MDLTTFVGWIGWAGIFIPLAALAWSAWSWIMIEKAKVSQRNFENFYQIILRIHNRDKSLISQTAAVFELRSYPEYKEFILTFCDNREKFFDDPIHPNLDADISRTADFFRKA